MPSLFAVVSDNMTSSKLAGETVAHETSSKEIPFFILSTNHNLQFVLSSLQQNYKSGARLSRTFDPANEFRTENEESRTDQKDRSIA